MNILTTSIRLDHARSEAAAAGGEGKASQRSSFPTDPCDDFAMRCPGAGVAQGPGRTCDAGAQVGHLAVVRRKAEHVVQHRAEEDEEEHAQEAELGDGEVGDERERGADGEAPHVEQRVERGEGVRREEVLVRVGRGGERGDDDDGQGPGAGRREGGPREMSEARRQKRDVRGAEHAHMIAEMAAWTAWEEDGHRDTSGKLCRTQSCGRRRPGEARVTQAQAPSLGDVAAQAGGPSRALWVTGCGTQATPTRKTSRLATKSTCGGRACVSLSACRGLK